MDARPAHQTPSGQGFMATAQHQEAEVERRLLALAFRNLPPMLGVTAITACGAALVLSHNGHGWAWWWLVGMMVTTALRVLGWRKYLRARADSRVHEAVEVRAWRRHYGLGLMISALTWTLPTFIAISTPSPAQYVLAIIMSALAGGGTGIAAAMREEGRLYIAIMLVPGSFFLMLTSPDFLILGILGLIFAAAMLVVHGNNHAIVRQSVTLQIENDVLVRNLRMLNAGLEEKVAERTEALERVANRDTLTGLPNRRGLTEWMIAQLRADSAHEAAVLFLDLDRFKQINDAMGHEVGDQVLQAVTSRLSQQLPSGAILARWGGDEFVVVIPHAEDVRPLTDSTAQNLLSAIARPYDSEGQQLTLGLSIGVAYYPTDAALPKDAILSADLAVAEVKRTGRGHMLAYSETYAETQRRRFDLGRALSAAIEADELELLYQPIIDARTRRVASLEALARWRHRELGDIDPAEFIGLAEDSDRIVALGDWVLRRACADAKTWTRSDGPPKVAVNISVKQMLHEGFALRVMQVLTQTGLPAQRLELEVTESVFDDDHLDTMRNVAASLRAIGVSVHIDDFGTGYSSLSRLHQFPVNAIKIDKSFVTRVGDEGSVIVESALMIARRFGMAVVAEGVETQEQADALSALGVDFMQGFHFARPSKIPRLSLCEPEHAVVRVIPAPSPTALFPRRGGRA